MTSDIDALEKMITESTLRLTKRAEFSDWYASESPKDGDLVFLNNSFIFRDKTSIKTRKNPRFIYLSTRNGKLGPRPQVAEVDDFNSPFKRLAAKSTNLPKPVALDQSIRAELKRLGQLVFVLMGEIVDEAQGMDLGHSYANELWFDPSTAKTSIASKGGDRRVLINQLLDPEGAWKDIEARVRKDIPGEADSFSAAFAQAFEKLRDEAVSKLRLPKPGAATAQSSFIGRLRESLADQRKLYAQALTKYETEGRNPVHLNEVLRIAYNFADDALKVLNLLVSLADLKAVLLWCTIDEHFALASAFKNLPWSKTTKKPSLSKYQEIIGGARNRAFHNLLAFDRTIESDLAGVTISAKSLTLLPAHGRRRGSVSFDYEDRELVEVLSELTLAPETTVSLEFWKRNGDVMNCFEILIARTEEALQLLNRARA